MTFFKQTLSWKCQLCTWADMRKRMQMSISCVRGRCLSTCSNLWQRERECVTKWERERESNWRMFVSKWVNDSKRVHERIVEFCWKRLTEKKITIWDSLRLVKLVLRKLKEYRQSKGYLKVCVKCSVTRCFYYLYYFAICNKEILPSCITYFQCLIKIVPN